MGDTNDGHSSAAQSAQLETGKQTSERGFFGRIVEVSEVPRQKVVDVVYCRNRNMQRVRFRGSGNPAWDFQLVIPGCQVGEEHVLHARAVYKPWEDERDIVFEYEKWDPQMVE